MVGNSKDAIVELVGDVCLILDFGFELMLRNTLYVPSFRRNLISVYMLGNIGFAFEIKNYTVNISFNSNVIGHCTLSRGLYRVCLTSTNIYACYNVTNVASKRFLPKEYSFMLWHKRLGHISRERVDRLIKFDILPTFHFSNLETCIDCCRGKMTKIRKKLVVRSSGVLDLIHTNISGPYSRNFYFITFIDDYSCYGYLFLIKEKLNLLINSRYFRLKLRNNWEKLLR